MCFYVFNGHFSNARCLLFSQLVNCFSCTCKDGETPGYQDYSLEYEYHSGPLPPPHNYGYAIEVRPDGTATHTLDIFGEESSEFNFTVAPAELEELCSLMAEQGVWSNDWQIDDEEDGKVGGSRRRLRVYMEDRTIVIPGTVIDIDDIKPVYRAINNLVPAEIDAQIERARSVYEENYTEEEEMN